jgi:hypothetical protein
VRGQFNNAADHGALRKGQLSSYDIPKKKGRIRIPGGRGACPLRNVIPDAGQCEVSETAQRLIVFNFELRVTGPVILFNTRETPNARWWNALRRAPHFRARFQAFKQRPWNE